MTLTSYSRSLMFAVVTSMFGCCANAIAAETDKLEDMIGKQGTMTMEDGTVYHEAVIDSIRQRRDILGQQLEPDQDNVHFTFNRLTRVRAGNRIRVVKEHLGYDVIRVAILSIRGSDLTYQKPAKKLEWVHIPSAQFKGRKESGILLRQAVTPGAITFVAPQSDREIGVTKGKETTRLISLVALNSRGFSGWFIQGNKKFYRDLDYSSIKKVAISEGTPRLHFHGEFRPNPVTKHFDYDGTVYPYVNREGSLTSDEKLMYGLGIAVLGYVVNSAGKKGIEFPVASGSKTVSGRDSWQFKLMYSNGIAVNRKKVIVRSRGEWTNALNLATDEIVTNGSGEFTLSVSKYINYALEITCLGETATIGAHTLRQGSEFQLRLRQGIK